MPPSRKKKAAQPARAGSTPAPELVNLETKGDQLKIYSLQTLLTNKRSPETRATARLGDVLLPWYEKVVAKPAQQLGPIAEFWQQLVPPALQNRSKLIAFSRGILTVAVDSATTRAELDGKLRAGLLRQIQTASRGTVFRIKTCVQSLQD